ncbi:hypothetical protein CGCF415_v014949 [Colletotrichum fructicola]|nr:hypothetical protein CGCF415_v014949 [Colletotrichum fructicola]KAF4932225.1 hypothetical protein CGCF245_v010846 [Colletotrichum fructicola]
MIQIQDIDEFPEPLDSEYARACAEIFEYLGEAHAPLPPGKLQILRGQIENDGSPTPCIRIIHRDFGNKQKMINFHLRFSRQRKRYDPPFTICYQNLSNLSSIGDSVSMTWTSREESLCGRLIETGAGKRQVRSTIGGLLEVGAKLYALTAYHSQDGEFGESSVPSTQDILEGLIDRGDFNYDIDPPTAVARYEGQTEFQEESVESTEKSKIDFSAAAGSILSTGSDWALVELDHDSMKLPNWLWFDVNQDTKDPDAKQPASSVVPRYLTSVMPPATSTQVQTVIVIAGVSGMVTATISRKLSQMRLDSGILVNVWTLSFDSFKGQGLKKGDSGSWVVEPQSGAVYGHVIASSHLNAFVLPLQTIMDEIDTEQCYLPTPFACFANLARNYRKSNNTDSAEEFAARAMADDVLEASTSNEFAQLIRARGSHPFTPAQTYSDLQPFTVFQYLVEKAGCRLPPYEEVVAWFTSEHTPFWKDFRASPIIVGQLWMRITRGNTIVTSFPKGYGRDLADPSSIYMSIRRKLADRATHIAIEPYDIALVIIDECIGAFFQRPESPAAELKAVPHGISALTQDVATIADKTWILREAHRTLLPSRSAVASSDILLQLLNLRLDIEELIQDLSMVAQVLAEQSTCVDDFIKMGALVAKGIQHDRLLSPDWIEPQLIKSRINSHKYEVKSLADTASGVHRTIVSLLQHVHLKTLLKEGTDFTRK